ncbi:MAG: hypothetical protein AAB518_01875 [Patescibacteria group bacterium]
MLQDSLTRAKWDLFLRRVWPFRYITFVDFVCAAGSLATGNMHENSDFDVIVAARYGRIFTVRFIAVALFGIFGFRRKRFDHHEEARDKICLSHFITEKSYRLSPPHGPYWVMLYQHLVPVVGKAEKFQSFWDANKDWMGERTIYKPDPRHRFKTKPIITRALENLLRGTLGDMIERLLRHFQIARIERGLSSDGQAVGYKPRIIYSDEELEFHPDTRRIEIFNRA